MSDINLDEMTVKQIREIAALAAGLGGGTSCSSSPNPYTVGQKLFIRTVTHHYTGRLVAVHDQELVIEDAAWIADDGRFNECLKNGTPSEVEPYPKGRVIIGRGSILDVSEWKHDLPDKVTV